MAKRALILAGVKWNTTIQRHHAVAHHLTKMGYKVYFVEDIVSSSFSVGKLVTRMRKILSRLNPKAGYGTVPTGGVKVVNAQFVNPHGGLFGLYNKVRVRRIFEIIPRDYDIAISYLPVLTTKQILDHIKYNTHIYDCVRDFSNWGGYPGNIATIEKELVSISDYVLVDSYYLTDKMQGNYPEKKIRQMLPMLKEGQADVFSKGRIPASIRSITYIGQIAEHIDTSVLDALVDAGYAVHHFGDSTIAINDAIISHGFMASPTALAKAILKHSDAIIIPYKGNMDGVMPAKLFECLATNLPVFINDFYDSRVLNRLMYVYTDTDDLLHKVATYNSGEFAMKNRASIKYLLEHSTEKEEQVLKDIITRCSSR